LAAARSPKFFPVVASPGVKKPFKPLRPRDIAALRQKLIIGQAVFAGLLNVPKVTAISWEKGRRQPIGATLRLLDLVRKKPQLLQEVA
jgi:DNA-binding transcriptional regulator YiaG